MAVYNHWTGVVVWTLPCSSELFWEIKSLLVPVTDSDEHESPLNCSVLAGASLPDFSTTPVQ